MKNSARTILIIEDEIVLQDVYKLILTSVGYNVVTASNGTEGIQKVKKLKPDLILLDIFMPQMDGKELLRNLDLENFQKMKVVVYSNLSDKATEKEMMELGAHAFFLKSSMTPNDLLDIVAKQLAK